MIGSLNRIQAIARNTLTEALRQRALLVTIIFGLVVVCGSFFMTELTFQTKFKFLKDWGYAAIGFAGTVVALLGAALLIPAEIERRTLYTTLSKPVRRFEFVLGKYAGLVYLITLMVLILSCFFAVVMFLTEQTTLRELTHGVPMAQLPKDLQTEVQLIHEQARDLRMVQAGLMLWAKLCVIAVISVFFSTLATSTVFIVCMTLLVVLIGHLQDTAREYWGYGEVGGGLHTGFLALVSWLIPDFNVYSIIDEIIIGNKVTWALTWDTLTYSAVYIAVVLVLSSLLFEGREV